MSHLTLKTFQEKNVLSSNQHSWGDTLKNAGNTETQVESDVFASWKMTTQTMALFLLGKIVTRHQKFHTVKLSIVIDFF